MEWWKRRIELHQTRNVSLRFYFHNECYDKSNTVVCYCEYICLANPTCNVHVIPQPEQQCILKLFLLVVNILWFCFCGKLYDKMSLKHPSGGVHVGGNGWKTRKSPSGSEREGCSGNPSGKGWKDQPQVSNWSVRLDCASQKYSEHIDQQIY